MIIVTGSRGFIGKNLVPLLKEIRHVNRRDGIDIANIPEKYFNGVETIYHLAGYIGNDIATHEAYLKSTASLLEGARKHDILNFVMMSSSAVYGQAEYLPVDEAHPLNPINNYGKFKLKLEELVRNSGEKYGTYYTILRIFNVYGKNSKSDVIARFLSNAEQEKKILVTGSGEQTRDFIDVRDVAEACVLLTGKKGIFNIGSGRVLSLNYVASLVKKRFPDIEIEYKNATVEEIQRSVADISLAKKCGFKPRRTIEEFISGF